MTTEFLSKNKKSLRLTDGRTNAEHTPPDNGTRAAFGQSRLAQLEVVFISRVGSGVLAC